MVLDLSDNKIEGRFEIGELNLLQELHLSKNRITALEKSKVSLKSLKILDLKYNLIEEWSTTLDCPKLKDFCVSFNKITRIKEESLINCVEIEVFDIRDNDIRKFIF